MKVNRIASPRQKRLATELIKKPEKSERIVKQQKVGKYWVSTVFLGLDYNWTGQGKPILFETMVFKGKQSDLDMDRYRTWEEAMKGHILMVKKYKKL